MEKETKTVEVQVYLKSIWRKPSEKPSNKGYGDNVIPVMLIDSQNNVYNFQFVSDDMDWDAVAINKDIIFWTYVTDILPLGLDTYQKARYFGTQFLELWTEYIAYNFKVGECLK